MKILRGLVVVAVMSAALSGCQSPAAAPNVEPPSAPEPTPTATQARETGLVAPARPFGGDCAAVMSVDEASDVLGQQAVVYTPGETYAPEVTAELHAGFGCRWVPADGSYASTVWVVFLPADAVSYEPPTGCLPADEMYSAPRCAVEAVVNGIRVSGVIWVSSDSMQPATSATASFLAIFKERAEGATPVPVPLPAVGAWANPVECQDVVAAADFSGVPGLGASAVGIPFPFGGDVTILLPAEVALEDGDPNFPYCWIDGEAADVTFVAMGGGRWLESTVAATGTPFAIEGYESAYVTPGQENLTKVDIFHGPNWLHFQIVHTSNAKALADALFAGLNATAVS